MLLTALAWVAQKPAHAVEPRLSTSPKPEEFRRSHILPNPLIPLGARPTADENRALGKAMRTFHTRKIPDDYSTFEAFLKRHPRSPWKPALLLNLGQLYFQSGMLSKSFAAYSEAWKLSRSAKSDDEKRLGDHIFGELIKMHSRLGHADSLQSLLAQIEGREFAGTAKASVVIGKDALSMMRGHPDKAYRCGPIALSEIAARKGAAVGYQTRLFEAQSTTQGISMDKVTALAHEIGLNYRAAKRKKGAPLILPALMHWKESHYSAIVDQSGDSYRIVDPTFQADLWVRGSTLDEEASGYFLIPEGELPPGWEPVADEDLAQLWGRAGYAGPDRSGTGEGDEKSGGDGPDCPKGMPIYRFHTMLASLNIVDQPLGYDPPRGPPVHFKVTYNSREYGQPYTFNYSNLGQNWTHGWLAYVQYNPNYALLTATVYAPGGGSEVSYYFDSTTSLFPVNVMSQTRLKRVSANPIRFERKYQDGSKEIYGLSDGSTTATRNVFLTAIVDAMGDTLKMEYDAQFRLVRVKDALGQVTTLEYGLAGDALKITRVTDPFGRSAVLNYDSGKRLKELIDVAGLASRFTYLSTGSNITAMTTPYGTTRFTDGEGGNWGQGNWHRYLEAVDPMGRTERLEYRHFSSEIQVEPLAPVGMQIANTPGTLPWRNSFYWDKKAMLMHPGDYRKARVSHFFTQGGNLTSTGRLLASSKAPFEGRVWLEYPNQGNTDIEPSNSVGLPRKVGRVLDDSSTQVYAFEYNENGLATKSVDPLGRETRFAYAPNGLDLISVRQKNGAGSDLLDTLTYNSQHLPLTHRDASGMLTTYVYNAHGQLTLAVNARGDSTRYAYDSVGYLTRVTGSDPADTIVFTHDAIGRLRTQTNREGFTTRHDYDALDRPTRISYPDSTFEQFIYEKLDLAKSRDRRGLWTHYTYNATRELTSIRDPQGQTTNLEWCGCGGLESLTDAGGRKTSWKRDAQGRVLEKVFADGRKILYAYENLTSRLKAMTDAKGQTKNFQYFLDDNLKQVSYANTTLPTASVSYTHDPVYNRVLTMTDGLGLTGYGYLPVTVPPTLGAGRLTAIDGPWANDSITYAYDSLGRTHVMAIQGIRDSVAFDRMGRVPHGFNALGSFNYKYVGATSRLDSLLYPNGQKTAYQYFTSPADFRLKEIKHLNPALAQLSRFAYAYDAEGQIKTWTQQADVATPVNVHLNYDAADQLIGVVAKSASTGTLLKHWAYSYDKSGNRIGVQEDSLLNAFTYNSLNQVTSQSPGGKMRFRGQLNELGTVTLDGVPTTQAADSSFDAMVTVNPGTDTVTLVAQDYALNADTNRYQVSSTGSSRTFTYDLNGNMTDDGTRTFEWDGEDRLVAVNQGALRSEFTYDGLDRRVRIVEKSSGDVTSHKTFLWVGNTIAEERDAAGGAVAKRYFALGMQSGEVKYFYTKDHLGSIREMTNEDGAVVARYDYDAFGIRTKLSGTQEADFGFTGHFYHATSGLHLSKYRAYSAELGRWISRDPIEEKGGLSLYGYVENNPVNFVDPLGLRPCPRPPGRGPGGRGRGRGNGPGSEPPVFGKPNTDGWGNPRPDPRPPSGRTPGEVVEAMNGAGNGSRPTPAPNPPATAGSRPPDTRPSSSSRMNEEVKRGQAPADVTRVDPASPTNPNGQPHIHYTNGTASNRDGTTSHEGRGVPNPPKATRKWITGHGWTPP